MRAFLACALLAAIAAPAPATRGDASGRDPVRISFTPPDADGGIYLGIFDARKRLVRTLFAGAEAEDFTIGLNGLIATWDGRDDVGAALPSGWYSAHGYVVGRVEVEGADFHFNDWVAYDGLAVRDVRDIAATEGDLVVLGAPPGASLFRMKPDGAVRWNADGAAWRAEIGGFGGAVAASGDANLPEARRLAADAAYVTAVGRTLAVFSAQTGRIFSAHEIDGLAAAAAIDGGCALVVCDGRLRKFEVPFVQGGESHAAPGNVDGVSASGGVVWTWRREPGAVWAMGGGKFAPVPWDAGSRIIDLAAGRNGGFWAITESTPPTNRRVVREFDAEGMVRRELDASPAEPQPERIAVLRDAEIALLERSADGGRLRCLRRRDAGVAATADSGVVDWEIVLERGWAPCARFGLVDGRLVADTGGTPQADSVRIELPRSVLDRAARSLVLRAAFDEAGSYLETDGGLRLVKVSSRPNLRRVLVAPRARRGSVRVFQGDGIVVEEFDVRRLDRIAYFDCGSFELK